MNPNELQLLFSAPWIDIAGTAGHLKNGICPERRRERDAEDTSAAVSLPAVLWHATGFTRSYIKGYTNSPLSCAEPQAVCV